MDIALVIDRLVPAAEFRMADTYANLVATWTDARTVPTEAAISAEWDVYLAEQAATKYQRDRAAEYPPVADQLDAIYHALKNLNDTGTSFPKEVTDWLTTVEAVKVKYPSS